jgi:hypothetical protein
VSFSGLGPRRSAGLRLAREGGGLGSRVPGVGSNKSMFKHLIAIALLCLLPARAFAQT